MPKNVVIFDIDGCIISPSEARIAAIIAEEWDTYHKLHHEDTPIECGIRVYSLFANDPSFRCVFITGRGEAARQYTQEMLDSIGLGHVKLLMRPNHLTGHEVHDAVLKPQLLQEAGYKLEDVFLAFDDRNTVVEAWRALGVTCYQTQPGDF